MQLLKIYPANCRAAQVDVYPRCKFILDSLQAPKGRHHCRSRSMIIDPSALHAHPALFTRSFFFFFSLQFRVACPVVCKNVVYVRASSK
uniref:Uncharacterized protein n=1 Tax=Trichogramma kaykai TaxID=54128 RepID=A0ABD2WEL4_9HYME